MKEPLTIKELIENLIEILRAHGSHHLVMTPLQGSGISEQRARTGGRGRQHETRPIYPTT